MLSRIENQAPINLAISGRAQTATKSTQVFSDLLAGESAGAQSDLKPASSTQPRAASVSCQVPAAAPASSQILDTTQPAATTSFNPLAIFEPKPAPAAGSAAAPSTNSTESPVGAQTANATDASFVPEFQQNLEVVSAYGGSSPLNPIYFATPETAQWIANKYGTGEVVARPYDATGGPYSANGTEYYIQLANGKMVNAGLLADYYQRMPESQFPGLADRIIRQGLGEA
jgi:hypothetical protein